MEQLRNMAPLVQSHVQQVTPLVQTHVQQLQHVHEGAQQAFERLVEGNTKFEVGEPCHSLLEIEKPVDEVRTKRTKPRSCASLVSCQSPVCYASTVFTRL